MPVTATPTTPSPNLLTPKDSNPSLSSLVGDATNISVGSVQLDDAQWGARFFPQQTTSTNPTNSTPSSPPSPTTSTSSFQYLNKESELEQVNIEGELGM